MEKIILASASPRRRELLEQIGLKFDIVVSTESEEDIDKTLPPELYTAELAIYKATAVAKKLSELNRKNTIIIAADTIVYKGNKILGKPKNEADAVKMLKLLSAKPHEVYTGICVMRLDDGFAVSKSVKSKVYFKELTDEVISSYISTNEYADKAGAYGIQGMGAVLVDKIEGDYFNIVGLPLSELYDVLKNEFNFDVFNV